MAESLLNADIFKKCCRIQLFMINYVFISHITTAIPVEEYERALQALELLEEENEAYVLHHSLIFFSKYIKCDPVIYNINYNYFFQNLLVSSQKHNIKIQQRS